MRLKNRTSGRRCCFSGQDAVYPPRPPNDPVRGLRITPTDEIRCEDSGRGLCAGS